MAWRSDLSRWQEPWIDDSESGEPRFAHHQWVLAADQVSWPGLPREVVPAHNLLCSAPDGGSQPVREVFDLRRHLAALEYGR